MDQQRRRPLEVSGVVSGAYGLTKAGTGLLLLTGSNAYTGDTTINGGTLQLGDGTSGHDGSVSSNNIYNYGSLLYNLVGPQTYSGVISGSGGLTKTGAGTLILTNANTFSGPTTITGGTLQLGTGYSDGSLAGTGSITNNGALVFAPATDLRNDTYSNALSGTGSLFVNGTGSILLGGTNPLFSGPTTVNSYLWVCSSGAPAK